MNIRKISDLIGGEILARTVMTSDYKILLSKGTVLSKEYIEKLGELDIKEVFVEEEIYTEEVEIVKDEIGIDFKNKIKRIIEKHTFGHSKELVELSRTADNIINNLLEKEGVLEKIYDIKERSSDIYEHSISVCYLAILVGLKMKIPMEKIHDIGVACLLHDLGLRYIMVNYTGRNMEEFSKEELTEYKKHPIYGYSALENESWMSSLSKDIILYHHEHMNGSGYPLKITSLPFEVKIVNICEQFDEMICGIGHKRLKVYDAIQHLKKYRNIYYDGTILDIFLDFAAVYPAGSYVLTNENEIGIVLKQNKNHSDRPVIKIIYDKYGEKIQHDLIKNLLTEDKIFIKKVIENI